MSVSSPSHDRNTNRINIRPNVDYFCDMNYDPFQYLNQNNRTYGECPVSLLAPALTMGAGFTIALYETPETVTTLWDSVKGNTNL